MFVENLVDEGVGLSILLSGDIGEIVVGQAEAVEFLEGDIVQGLHTGVFNFPVAEQLLNNESGIGEPVDTGLAGIKVIVVKIAGEPVETGDDGVVFGLVIGFFA